MKKILIVITVFTFLLVLSACKPEDIGCPKGQVFKNGICEDEIIPIPIIDYDENATLNLYTTGVTNMNPYIQDDSSSSEIFSYITDSLYTGDYDWDKAIIDGVAEYRGDFSSGASQIPYGRVPAMADTEPVDVNGDGTVWQITIKEGLVFEDGTIIDANTFEWSWMQLLDPNQKNLNANSMFNKNISVLNAENYYVQNDSRIDTNGYLIYDVNGVEFNTENALYGHIIDHEDWLLYYVSMSSPWNSNTLVGPNGSSAYLENWGGYENLNSLGLTYFLVTETGECFWVTSEGELYAPEDGWMLNGVEVPVHESEASIRAGANPALMDYKGDYAVLNTNGIPIDGIVKEMPSVEWDEVGIEAISDYVLQISLSNPCTAWDVKGNLADGSTGVVHQEKYEEGMSESGTSTSYGTIDNPLVSYGPYLLSTWNEGTELLFDINSGFYDEELYKIKHIHYDFLESQSVAVSKFKLNNLDSVEVGGQYFNEFQDHSNLKLIPRTTLFRFALNIEGSDTYESNPILTYLDFREALYYAFDRDAYVEQVSSPGYTAQGFIGPNYLASPYSTTSYRESFAGQNVLANYSSDLNGYDPVKAKELFDKAYDRLVVDNDSFQDGDVVSLEFKIYDVETSYKPIDYIESFLEEVFNKGEETIIFDLTIAYVSSEALELAWVEGNFDITFAGWEGYAFDAPKMLGEVYNSHNNDTMLERGFDTADAVIELELVDTFVALNKWTSHFNAMTSTPTSTEQENYNSWVVALAKFDSSGTITCTYDELYNLAYGAFYNEVDLNYEGKADDYNKITAAMETVLLDQMISIPMFTRVGASVYSERVIFEQDEYNAIMQWGGIKYMYIALNEVDE